MCGFCGQFFSFNEELAYHIKSFHDGELPEGTIYGITKKKLFDYFSMPLISRGQAPPGAKYRCGCGNVYGCTASLRYHVKSKHQGIKPPGTIDKRD
jgi:hypothetical protein